MVNIKGLTETSQLISSHSQPAARTHKLVRPALDPMILPDIRRQHDALVNVTCNNVRTL
jgi:hypothetical protein